MNWRNFLLTGVIVFAGIVALEYIAHQVVMLEWYQKTAKVWRAEDDMNLVYTFLSQFLFAMVFVFIFTRNYENKGIAEGIRYGTYVGLLIAALQVATYSYLPIPLTIMLGWVVVSFVKGLISGVITSLVYTE